MHPLLESCLSASGRSKVAHSARQVKLSMALGQKEAVNALTPEHYPSLTPATVSRGRGEWEGGAVAGIACPVCIQFAFPTESYTFS